MRAIPGVEAVSGGSYRRTAHLDGRPAVVELCRDTSRPARLKCAAQRIFGLDADHGAIDSVLRSDPRLAPLVTAHPALRIPGCWDGFELAVRAVLGQQVSVAAGRGLAARIVSEHGEALPEPANGLTHLFPGPAELAEIELGGMPASRARAIRALANAVAGGLAIDETRDRDGVRAGLLELPGIGPWTVEYIAMRALRDPDAFPAGDHVLRNAMSWSSEAEARRAAEAWRPWRAYAAMHIWTAVAEDRPIA